LSCIPTCDRLLSRCGSGTCISVRGRQQGLTLRPSPFGRNSKTKKPPEYCYWVACGLMAMRAAATGFTYLCATSVREVRFQCQRRRDFTITAAACAPAGRPCGAADQAACVMDRFPPSADAKAPHGKFDSCVCAVDCARSYTMFLSCATTFFGSPASSCRHGQVRPEPRRSRPAHARLPLGASSS